jgi:hypothetical protein
VEKGFQCQRDLVTVKIFEVLTAEMQELDPSAVAVSLDAVTVSEIAQLENTGKCLVDIYRSLFDKWPAFVLPKRQ